MKRTILLAVSLIVIGLTAAFGQTQTTREQTVMNIFGRLNLTVDPFENLNRWTDDDAFYSPFFADMSNIEIKPRANGDTIYLYGGTLHEGGWKITVLLDDAGKMKIADNDYRFMKGDVVDYCVIGDTPFLIFKDVRTGLAKYVLRKFDGKLYDRITGNYRRYILSGKYIQIGNYSHAEDKITKVKNAGRNIVFALDKSTLSGFNSSGERTYKFAEDYETPIPILIFGDQEIYKVTKTLIGLELAPMTTKLEEWDEITYSVDESKPVFEYSKSANLIQGLPPGRFPLVSVEVMTLVALHYYAGTPKLSNLQVMRNEIFARHGYKFRPGGDMDGYFCTQDWYEPKYDDVTSKLTEIERINIALIQILEKELSTGMEW